MLRKTCDKHHSSAKCQSDLIRSCRRAEAGDMNHVKKRLGLWSLFSPKTFKTCLSHHLSENDR